MSDAMTDCYGDKDGFWMEGKEKIMCEDLTNFEEFNEEPGDCDIIEKEDEEDE